MGELAWDQVGEEYGMSIRQAIGRVIEGHDLDDGEAQSAMREIVEGEATPSQIAAFVTALRMKGETATEIAGLARVMREYATKVGAGPDVVDLVGTGGDGSYSFNISTVSAFVVAAAGAKVAKHGNRGVTSSCGSADILEGLDIAIDLGPAQVARSIQEAGFGFMFAPIYHPAMRHAGATRREIGVRTVFNLLGPVTNPAGASRQLTGVAVANRTETIARVLALLGCRRALVVHGAEGLDEISISGPTHGFLVEGGEVTPLEITPEAYGLQRAPSAAVRGGTVEENLRFVTSVLNGEQSAARDVVLLNAGAGLFVAGLAENPRAGVALAAELIDSGKAAVQLERVREMSAVLQRETSSVNAS
jgi:anthranilate phosphoribosyltransferase